MDVYCKQCKNKITTKHAKIFCSSSCAAKYNNKGVRRHGKPKNICLICDKPTDRAQTKYCSNKCSGIARTTLSDGDRKRINCHKVMKYRARKNNQTPSDADMEIIKEIYKQRPEGYEVDHIIPLSRGGLHHQDNLQYLTKEENQKKGNKLNWRV